MPIIKCSIPSDKERRRWITNSVTHCKICLAEMNTWIVRLEITSLGKIGAFGKVQNITLHGAGTVICIEQLQLRVLTSWFLAMSLELFPVKLQESAWVSGWFEGLQKQCCNLLSFQHKKYKLWPLEILLTEVCASGRSGYRRATISLRNILSLEIYWTVYMSLKDEVD